MKTKSFRFAHRSTHRIDLRTAWLVLFLACSCIHSDPYYAARKSTDESAAEALLSIEEQDASRTNLNEPSPDASPVGHQLRSERLRAKPEATPRNRGVLKALFKKAFVLLHTLGNVQAHDPYSKQHQVQQPITPYDPLALFARTRHYMPAHSSYFNTIHPERGLRLSEMAAYRRKIKQYDVSELRNADSLAYPEFTSLLHLENNLLSPTPSRKLSLERREGESIEDYLERERLHEEGCEIVAEEEAQYLSQIAEDHTIQKSTLETGMDIEQEDQDQNSLVKREPPPSRAFTIPSQLHQKNVLQDDILLKKKNLLDIEETDIENDDQSINSHKRSYPFDFSPQSPPQKKVKPNRRLAEFSSLKPNLKESVQKLKIFNVGQGNGIILSVGEGDKRACWIFDAGYDNAKPSRFYLNEPFKDKKSVYENMYTFLKDVNCLEEASDKIEILKPIYILITHADADHYNLVRNVFEGDVYVDKKLKRTREITKGGDKLTFIRPKQCASKDCTLTDFGSDSESKLGEWTKKHVGNVDDEKLLSKAVVLTAEDLKEQECETQAICFLNIGENGRDKNSNSLVTRVSFEGKHFLLPGDATWTTYEKMKGYQIGWKNHLADKKTLKDILDQGIDYLVVPHHGAATKSSHGWIYKVKPKEGVIFSAPMYSHHHHPTLASVYAAVCALGRQGALLPDNQSKLIYWDTAGRDTDKEKVLSGEDKMQKVSKKHKACDAYESYEALEGATELKVDHDTKAKRLYSYNLMPQTFTNGLKDKVVEEAEHFKEALIYHIGRTELPIYITGLDGHITFEKDLTLGGVKIKTEISTLFATTTIDKDIKIVGHGIEEIVNKQIKELKKPSKLNFQTASIEALFLKHFAIR